MREIPLRPARKRPVASPRRVPDMMFFSVGQMRKQVTPAPENDAATSLQRKEKQRNHPEDRLVTTRLHDFAAVDLFPAR